MRDLLPFVRKEAAAGLANWANTLEDGTWNDTGYDDTVRGCIVEFEP